MITSHVHAECRCILRNTAGELGLVLYITTCSPSHNLYCLLENETMQSETMQSENETMQSENETMQSENETMQSENETMQSENETMQSESGPCSLRVDHAV